MGKGDPVQTPYVYDSGTDYQGHHLSITFNFENISRLLLGAVVHRDVGCVYIAILVGDPNNDPTRYPASGEVPEGDTNITAAQLIANGYTTIEDVLLQQITCTANP